jgi:hypothetical protein
MKEMKEMEENKKETAQEGSVQEQPEVISKSLRELSQDFNKKDTPENRMNILSQINKKESEIVSMITKTLDQGGFTINGSIAMLNKVKDKIMNAQFIMKD